MEKQTKTVVIDHRLANTRHEYWTLNLVLDGKIVNTHTSKSKSYIYNIASDWTK